MGSKGSQTVTQSGQQSQQYTPNQPILGMGQQAGSMATTAAGAPFQQPVAPVAPFNAFQGLGFGETLGLQGMAQPYFNVAGNYLAGSAAPITGSDVANYYNPMAASVTGQLQNIFGQQNVQNTGNLVQTAGGVGADRVAVGQANMANQQTLAAGQVYSQLYQQALQAAQQNKQMQAGAGFAFGQMGPAAQAAQQNAVNQLLGVGAQQQQLSQAEMNAIYQNQLAQIAYPFQTAQYLSGITAGLAPAMGGQTQGQYSGQTTYPSPSPFAQALGVGTGLLGMFGGMGGMGAMGLGAMGAMPFGSAMQYLPGGSAYGATPSYQNGGYYPMFDEGGAVDDNYGNLANKEKYQEYGKIIPYAAQGNPAAETFLKDVGYDDGGGIDPTLGQPAPMGLNLDPGSGLPFPGAGKVRGSPVPQSQLPTGQGGRSGLYGQQMIMHPPPSMPQGGGQQQGGLGQLAGSLGKSLGSLGNGAFGGLGSLGDAAGGAGLDMTAEQAGMLGLDLIGARHGGRIPRMAPGGMAPMGQPATPIPPMTSPAMPPMQPPPGTGAQAFPPPGAPAQPPPMSPPGGSLSPGMPPPGQMPPGVPPTTNTTQRPPGMPMPQPLSFSGPSPFSGPMPSRPPGMDTGGGLGGQPNGGRLAPNARRWQGFESRFPKDAPPMDWRVLPAVDKSGMFGQVAAGGVVDPMRPGEGYGDDDADIQAVPGMGDIPGPMSPAAPPSDVSTLGMMGRGAKQIGDYIADKWNTMTAPASPPVIPPEVQSQYPSEGHPNLKDQDRPFENVPTDDESAAYGPGVGRLHQPAETLSDTTGREPATIRRAGVGEAGAPGPYEALPSDVFGHGMNQPPGAQGAVGQPSGLDMAPFRRATMQQETWLPGSRKEDPYQNITATRRADGSTQRALGAYGIMENSLADWGPSVFGRRVSPEEFLRSPQLQDQLYDAQMGKYIKSYGVQGAGRAWLGGEGALNAPMRADPFGTRVGDYGNRFAQLVQQPGGGGGGQSLMTNGMRRSDNVEDNRQSAMGPMGSRNVPFPGATDPNNFARRMTSSPWFAAMRAGARMAQTPGPIGSVIGAGLGEAGRTFEGQRAALDSEEAINQKAEHLALLADAHLRRYTQMTPSEEATHAETRRYHDMIAQMRGSGLWNTERAKLEQEPGWMGRNEDDKDMEVARRLAQGRQQGVPQPERPPGVPPAAQYSQKTGTWWTQDGKEWGKPEQPAG